ncbi:MAG: aldo/keto reductase, partial [Xanthomonadales bacterium]|nr:aldo/keto reductase [Xanthomonadales bacterium]
MILRPLGRSGIDVAPLAFGGNVFGWSADAATSFRLLDRFTDAGFNLVDTADMYSSWVPGNSGGESETIIGDWLRRSGRRGRVVVATKVAKWAKRPGLAPANIRAACDESLRRLGVERIDLYQAHEDDPKVPIEDTLGAFARLIEDGKVRAIGASNYDAKALADALEASRRHGLPRYETLQPEYNLYARAGYESALEPLARAEDLGVIGYYSLASGFLSGKYRSGADLARSKARGGDVAKYLDARGLRILAKLDEVAARRAATPAQVALAWLILVSNVLAYACWFRIISALPAAVASLTTLVV